MQKFTLRSEADNGVVIEYSFESEYLPGVQEQVNKFLEASGFVLPEEEADEFEFRVSTDDYVARSEDYLWDDAFESKFGAAALGYDGIVGASGADIISFPTRNEK